MVIVILFPFDTHIRSSCNVVQAIRIYKQPIYGSTAYLEMIFLEFQQMSYRLLVLSLSDIGFQ